jgi:hypothetical protein
METSKLEDSCVADAFVYTSVLAASMQDTKLSILRKLIDESAITSYLPNHKSYEIKVDFK